MKKFKIVLKRIDDENDNNRYVYHYAKSFFNYGDRSN